MALAPRDINARLLRGNLLNRSRMPDRALQVAAEIQADPSLQPLDPQVKLVDTRILLNEARDVMGGQAFPWEIKGTPFPDLYVKSWDPKFAEQKFLDKFHDLTHGEFAT